MERILQNLLDNAVKYSAEKSIIRVLTGSDDAGFPVTSVIDQGKGISKEVRGKLFQLFSRLDETNMVTGLGLGLVVCQRPVEAHGGWIKVESKPGHGSTFSFGLPLH